MARALIVGCGCRGRELGKWLLTQGWEVRGTTRRAEGLEAIEAVGIEARIADPVQPATVLDAAVDAAVVVWLLGSARGHRAALEEIHGTKLERFLQSSVETPMRRFVYEAAGSVDRDLLERGAAVVCTAGDRWSIPHALIERDLDMAKLGLEFR
jgi:nucleoside-diphosphate-sugar epimerase